MSEYQRHKIVKWRTGYRFQFEKSQNKHVILYPEGMIQLNESAGLIGELINNQRTGQDIIVSIQSQFPNVPEIEQDIDDFMNVAFQQHWIEFQ